MCAERVLAISLISGVLILDEILVPSRKTPLLDMLILCLERSSPTFCPSEISIFDVLTRKADARYIAPVSKYSKPNSAAILFAVVLLPEAAGPSIAINSGSQTHTLSLRFGKYYQKKG